MALLANRHPGGQCRLGFLSWFDAATGLDGVLRAALAHFWFVTIHPFDDGNGPIARAVADMALARSERSAQRFLSMSARIRDERDAHYDLPEEAQKGTHDVTSWTNWFPDCLGRAIDVAETTLAALLHKPRFWEGVASVPLNERQRLLRLGGRSRTPRSIGTARERPECVPVLAPELMLLGGLRR